MKKLAFFVMVTMILTSTAMATPWTWDLSSTGYLGMGTPVDGYVGTTVNFVDSLGAASAPNTTSTVVQSLGGNGVLSENDTFTEFGMLNILDADNLGLQFLVNSPSPSLIPAVAYVEFNGLSGSIFNYNNGGDGDTTLANYTTAAANDTYDLQFNPNIGTIKIFLDTDFNSANGAFELASMNLLAGQGHSPELILGAAEGQFGLLGGFTSVAPGVWNFIDGTSFEDWMSMYGTPSIFMTSYNLGATFAGIGDNGTDIVFQVLNEGSFQLSAVPEPSTLLLLGCGIMGLCLLARRRKA